MKKQYSTLLSIVGIEILIVSILNKANVKIASWIGNAVGTFIFFLPIQILLFLLSKDKALSTKLQVCCKFAFWFIFDMLFSWWNCNAVTATIDKFFANSNSSN